MKRSIFDVRVHKDIIIIICIGDLFGITIDICQFWAVGESIASFTPRTYTLYTTADIYGGHAAATIKGIVADAGHVVWNNYGGQTAAVIEGIVADAGHVFRDSDGGQTAAALKGIVADAGHVVWNNYGVQTAATCVFANYFISVICKLNGRKVVT